ncbi:hypothetical protein [Alkalimarinus sediminis]|uniref:Uncharacterized protein n=1 Tax=Alkalimarinus sediminis TaxID=1632866 RepID=A0A9E8HNP6_9ALTE|nr:hypothetical protein [Alkalimarinus sediminis]UZW76291.1 hypothetical protein NNL22_06825 [Alkalimarinus sediminis]
MSYGSAFAAERILFHVESGVGTAYGGSWTQDFLFCQWGVVLILPVDRTWPAMVWPDHKIALWLVNVIVDGELVTGKNLASACGVGRAELSSS